MSESTPLAWSCPACGRRVPLRVDRCHCGRMRDAGHEPERPAPPRGAEPAFGGRAPLGRATGARRQAAAIWRSMPRDIKAFVVAGTLVVVAGIGWTLFGPRQPDTTPAILGYIDATPPPPTPKPPTRPPLKLPWWR